MGGNIYLSRAVSGMQQIVFRSLAPPLAFVLLTGCLSPQNKIAKEIPALHDRWQADVARQSALPERVLSWPEALALLQQNNLKLRAPPPYITTCPKPAPHDYPDLTP